MYSPPHPCWQQSCSQINLNFSIISFSFFLILVILVSWFELRLVFEVMIGLEWDLRSSPSTLELCWTVNNSYWMTNHFEMIEVNLSLTIKQESWEVFDASDFFWERHFSSFSYFNVCHHVLNRKAIASFIIGQILRLVVSNHVKNWRDFSICSEKKETQSHFLCYQA